MAETYFSGLGDQKILAERATKDINGNSLELTISDNKVTAIGGVSVSGSGSETNIIETVEVEGTPLTVTNKTVNITKTALSLNNVDNTSDSTKKTNFTGSIANSDTGFVTGGDVYTALSGKVDAVSGKGLSTNDYTTAEKEKVAIIPTGASAVSSLTCTSANTYAWAGWTNKTVKVLGRIIALYNGISNRGLDITSGSFGSVARDTSGPLVAPDGLGMPYYNRRNFGSTNVISMHDEFKSIFASNNFTIDFWVKLSGGSNNANQDTVLSINNNDMSKTIYSLYESYYDNQGCVTHSNNGRINFARMQWNHIAYVSNSQTNQSNLYLNGISIRTTDISSIIFTDINRLVFGYYLQYQLNSNLQCYLAQFTVRDYPVWTSDFTPPTIMY